MLELVERKPVARDGSLKQMRKRQVAVLIDENHRPAASGDFEWENQLVNGVWTYSMDMIHTGLQSCFAALKADVNDVTKRAIIEDYDRVLALDLLKPYPEEKKDDEDPEILAKIAERAAAKKAKDYAKADAIRAELAAQGITLIDTPQGTVYKKG